MKYIHTIVGDRAGISRTVCSGVSVIDVDTETTLEAIIICSFTRCLASKTSSTVCPDYGKINLTSIFHFKVYITHISLKLIWLVIRQSTVNSKQSYNEHWQAH